MLIDGSYTCGKHYIMCTEVETLHCTPEINVTSCVTSNLKICKKKKKERKEGEGKKSGPKNLKQKMVDDTKREDHLLSRFYRGSWKQVVFIELYSWKPG